MRDSILKYYQLSDRLSLSWFLQSLSRFHLDSENSTQRNLARSLVEEMKLGRLFLAVLHLAKGQSEIESTENEVFINEDGQPIGIR